MIGECRYDAQHLCNGTDDKAIELYSGQQAEKDMRGRVSVYGD